MHSRKKSGLYVMMSQWCLICSYLIQREGLLFMLLKQCWHSQAYCFNFLHPTWSYAFFSWTHSLLLASRFWLLSTWNVCCAMRPQGSVLCHPGSIFVVVNRSCSRPPLLCCTVIGSKHSFKAHISSWQKIQKLNVTAQATPDYPSSIQ